MREYDDWISWVSFMRILFHDEGLGLAATSLLYLVV